MKFTTSIAVFASAVTSMVSAQSGVYTDFANCANGPTQLTISTPTTLSPAPLCAGKRHCLTVTGNLSEPITESSTYYVAGRYLGRLIYTQTHDLCEILAANGLPCPIPAGPQTLNLCADAGKNFMPNVGVQFVFKGTNGDGGVLFCQSREVVGIYCK